MSAPADASATTPVRRSRPRRRWLRLAIPFALMALFWVVTIGAHAYQQPDLRDPGTLSPTGTGRHGSSELADRLRAQGVTVQRVTSTDEALTASAGQPATFFVPAPDLLDGRLVLLLWGRSEAYRVVLVRPGDRGMHLALESSDGVGSGWAARTVPPGCSVDYAATAGPATVHRDIYDIPSPHARCYDGSVVAFDAGLPGSRIEIVLVGATEPFRNDRIDEAGNSAFATGLLAEHGRVIWLDVHSREGLLDAPPAPSLPPSSAGGGGGYQRPDQDRASTGDPLLDAFPVQLWVVLALLAAVGLLAAVAAARRLGPPVAEPLPVLVPSAEAVLGRGRLYRRIRARQASLAALREAALTRLARTVDPHPPPAQVLGDHDAFVRAVAARAGLAEAAVSAILFGPAPKDDAGLVRATAELDRLVDAVAGGPAGTPRSPDPTAPPNPPETPNPPTLRPPETPNPPTLRPPESPGGSS